MEQFAVNNWKKNEIWFVVGVLVCVLGVSVFQLKLAQAKTRDAQRKSDVELVSRALNSYLAQTEVLPKATEDGRIVACGYLAQDACDWGGGPIIDELGVVYLNKIPQDPDSKQGRHYMYVVDAARKKYEIYVALEVTSDKSIRPNLTKVCPPGLQCNWLVKNWYE